AFDRSGSVYGDVVRSLEARGGFVPKLHFDIISGAPTRIKGHLSSETLLSNLIDINLLEPCLQDCIRFSSPTGLNCVSANIMRARLIAEEILLRALRDWLRKMGLVSYNKVDVRDSNSSLPKFGQFSWDLVA